MVYLPGYTWYIHGYTLYIHGPWIYHVYHMMYIHGIYIVYPRRFLLSETRFLGRPVLLVSFNAHTCVGDQECFIPRATMAIVPGEEAHKRLCFFIFPARPLLFAAFAAADWAAASSSSPGPNAPSLSPPQQQPLPSPPLSLQPPGLLAAAAEAAAVAQASFLAVSYFRISLLAALGLTVQDLQGWSAV
jgi:hypothetical protein